MGSSQRAKEAWEDIKAGVLRNISVGYSIIKGAPKGDDYLVSLWQLLEVSLVAVPADPTVGIGRSFVEGTTMENTQNIELESHLSRSQRRAAARSEDETRENANQIYTFAEQFNIPVQKVRSFTEQYGFDVDAFRGFVMNHIKDTGAIRQHESLEIGMSRHEASRFSFVKAIRASIDPSYAQRHCGLEIEASRAVAQKLGREPQGIFVPAEVLMVRDLTVGTPSAGGYLRPTDHYAEGFIDILRNSTHVINLGATELNDLQEMSRSRVKPELPLGTGLKKVARRQRAI